MFNMSLNNSYTTSPGYGDLVYDMYKAMEWYYRAENWEGYTFPQSFFDDFMHFYKFPLEEAWPIFYIAIIFTALRYFFEICICGVGFIKCQTIFTY